MPVKHRDSEAGFTMLATVLAMAVIMLLAVVAVAAVNGDTHQTRRDLNNKQAYEAAKAGVDDYAFHLNANTSYWAECTNVPAPNAVNRQGSTAKRRPVPGNTGATYAIELIPATTYKTAGEKQCNPTSLATATESMIQSGEELTGSFRIRSTGFAGESKASIVATFKPPSFLDYVYFTQLETLDPVTYGFPNPSPEYSRAIEQCGLTWQQGRYNKPIRGSEYCSVISFVTGDVIKGPLHTNDAISINGTPTFGRNAQDMIEVGTEEEPGWHSASSGSRPNFVGTFRNKAPILEPPSSNAQLEAIVQPAFHYSGQVRICLSGENMTVGKGATCTGVYSGQIPSNGVVYDSNEACGEVYSPFNATYPERSGCGNVYVKGEYTGQLTIAADNNIIINGSLVRTNSAGLLGLIANNFVRIYHPVCSKTELSCTATTAETESGHCNNAVNGTGSLVDPEIDAAILAINHSIIVDHYDCGSQLGTLNVEGAVAQKFRGPVGTTGNTGYLKNYVYDDRLKYSEPPSFIAPKTSAWVIGRETVE
jgi:type II secretory pathway pseudopilin PulG